MITIYEWPELTWCFEDELEEMLDFMSDDYEIITLTEEEFSEMEKYQ